MAPALPSLAGVMFAHVGWILVLGALAVAAAAVRRGRGGAAGARRVAALGPNHALYVVELEGRRWMVGTGPGQAPALLAELAPGPDASGPAEAAPVVSFAGGTEQASARGRG